MAKPTAYLSSITFSDGTEVVTAPTDIVVIVGPNNVGKSVALRDIHDKALSPKNQTQVVTGVAVSRSGTTQDVEEWLEASCRKQFVPSNPGNPTYSRLGTTIHKSQVENFWSQSTTDGLRELGKLFIYRLTTDARLDAAKPAVNIQLSTQPLTHPIHYMQTDDSIEMRMSEMFRQAFGEDLIVHRNAGSHVPLHVGSRPVFNAGEDRVSMSYIKRLETLPTLQSQGDGMRAFVGVLLHAFIVEHSAVLIDEPEAFLHPPQARLLGRMLVERFFRDFSGAEEQWVSSQGPGSRRRCPTCRGLGSRKTRMESLRDQSLASQQSLPALVAPCLLTHCRGAVTWLSH